ncbi:MAG: SDR family oxidoreductase [bacterium]|nr:SDR family oxidoreductase [bacterium]
MENAKYPELKGKTALVTGGSRGIGMSIVRGLIDQGCNVGINHRKNVGKSGAQAKELIEYAESKGQKAWSLIADIQSEKEIGRMFKKFTEECSPTLDYLILNAGSTIFKNFMEISGRELRSLAEINIFSNVHCVQSALPLFQPGASVVCISSTGTRKVLPGYPLGIMKSALEELVRYLDFELHEKNLRVNGICAGLTNTDTFQVLRDSMPEIAAAVTMGNRNVLLEPEEVADIVNFLCSQSSRAIQGNVLLADRGLTLN